MHDYLEERKNGKYKKPSPTVWPNEHLKLWEEKKDTIECAWMNKELRDVMFYKKKVKHDNCEKNLRPGGVCGGYHRWGRSLIT